MGRSTEGPLEDVLTTSWERPESTSQGYPLNVRFRLPLDVISGRPQDFRLRRPRDVRSGRPRDGQIGFFKGRPWGVGRARPGDQYLPAGKDPTSEQILGVIYTELNVD